MPVVKLTVSNPDKNFEYRFASAGLARHLEKGFEIAPIGPTDNFGEMTLLRRRITPTVEDKPIVEDKPAAKDASGKKKSVIESLKTSVVAGMRK